MSLFTPDTPKMLPEPVVAMVDKVDNLPFCRVRYAATTWDATLYNFAAEVTLLPGQPVKVIGILGITLLIEV